MMDVGDAFLIYYTDCSSQVTYFLTSRLDQKFIFVMLCYAMKTFFSLVVKSKTIYFNYAHMSCVLDLINSAETYFLV